MAKEQENQEPSIEEILDSIRQIISDDEEQAVAVEPAAPAPEPEVIELTERVKDEPGMQVDMKEPETPEEPPEREPEPVRTPPPPPPPRVEAKPEPRPEPPPAPKPAPRPETGENLETILTQNAEDSVMDAFSELAKRASVEKGQGITIEEIVRQELRPMLKHWLDYHLPGLVEKLLQKELERISKRVGGDE